MPFSESGDNMKLKLKKKKSGQGDLIASLIVIVALATFVLFFINAIGDVNTRIQLDQIARKYILRMEASGELSAADAAAIKDECNKIVNVYKATAGQPSEINVTWNDGHGAGGYGSSISLQIKCPALVTGFDGDSTDSTFGMWFKTKKTYVIKKQSTAKY